MLLKPLELALIGLVRLYQLTLGKLLPPRCRFHPSCSAYAIDALRLNGPVIGLAQAAWRLLRCAPWGKGGIDEARPVRLKRRGTAAPAANSRKNLEATTMGSHG